MDRRLRPRTFSSSSKKSMEIGSSTVPRERFSGRNLKVRMTFAKIVAYQSYNFYISVMEKKKFLFVSLSGLIGDIAWQVVKEGHEVKYYIHAESERDIADGFVPKTLKWEDDVEWADVIVFDDTL